MVAMIVAVAFLEKLRKTEIINETHHYEHDAHDGSDYNMK